MRHDDPQSSVDRVREIRLDRIKRTLTQLDRRPFLSLEHRAAAILDAMALN